MRYLHIALSFLAIIAVSVIFHSSVQAETPSNVSLFTPLDNQIIVGVIDIDGMVTNIPEGEPTKIHYDLMRMDDQSMVHDNVFIKSFVSEGNAERYGKLVFLDPTEVEDGEYLLTVSVTDEYGNVVGSDSRTLIFYLTMSGSDPIGKSSISLTVVNGVPFAIQLINEKVTWEDGTTITTETGDTLTYSNHILSGTLNGISTEYTPIDVEGTEIYVRSVDPPSTQQQDAKFYSE